LPAERGEPLTIPFVLEPRFGKPVGETLRETTRLINLVDKIKPEVLGTF